ncbi:MAG: hypothetical protein KDB56_18175 [Mycobacterium sp.]|nr:hypothetical protein [Mycobacterium sp.]
MKKAAVFLGGALAAASLALAGPAYATPATPAGVLAANATAAAAPGQLSHSGPKSSLCVQDSGNKNYGARVGTATAAGSYSRVAMDGIIRPSGPSTVGA